MACLVLPYFMVALTSLCCDTALIAVTCRESLSCFIALIARVIMAVFLSEEKRSLSALGVRVYTCSGVSRVGLGGGGFQKSKI